MRWVVVAVVVLVGGVVVVVVVVVVVGEAGVAVGVGAAAVAVGVEELELQPAAEGVELVVAVKGLVLVVAVPEAAVGSLAGLVLVLSDAPVVEPVFEMRARGPTTRLDLIVLRASLEIRAAVNRESGVALLPMSAVLSVLGLLVMLATGAVAISVG